MNVTGKRGLVQGKHWAKVLCCLHVRRSGLSLHGANLLVEQVMLNVKPF